MVVPWSEKTTKFSYIKVVIRRYGKILQNFGSLACLIIFKIFFKLFKIYFIFNETLRIVCFYKHSSFSRILNSWLTVNLDLILINGL